MQSLTVRLSVCALILGTLPLAANAAHMTFGPTPYLQTGDTPAGFGSAGPAPLVIEDFEDNALDPFLSISPGMILPPNFLSGGQFPVTDSVDGDDGSVDGFGLEGYSWFSGSVRALTVTFDDPVIYAGLVFTDAAPESTVVKLEAFNGATSIGVIDAGDLADGTFTGETAEDSFLGFKSLDGITSLKLTINDGLGIEIDHVHYQVPEPAALGMTLVGLIGLAGLRRRRR